MQGAGDASAGDPPEKSIFDQMGGAPALRHLLHHFYADVRQDEIIGPIFNARIHDWPSHLDTIGSFWARQTGGSSNYSGGFGSAHLSLGLQPEHFQRWLGLWERHCRQHLYPVVAQLMIARAHDLGNSLKRILRSGGGLRIGP